MVLLFSNMKVHNNVQMHVGMQEQALFKIFPLPGAKSQLHKYQWTAFESYCSSSSYSCRQPPHHLWRTHRQTHLLQKRRLCDTGTSRSPTVPPVHRSSCPSSPHSLTPDAAKFSSLAAGDPFSLSKDLHSFCSAANLLCNPDLLPSLATHSLSSSFAVYEDKNFTNYGTNSAGATSVFSNYSGFNIPFSVFRRYGRDGAGPDDEFSLYGTNGNVVGTNFSSYGGQAAGGVDNFTSYAQSSNVPILGFNNYATFTAGRVTGFSHYSNNANSGDQDFSGYGKAGAGPSTAFTSYANDSNVIKSEFANYGKTGTGNGETFTSYADHGNVPENIFRTYGTGTNGGTDQFTSYRDQSNVGDDSFSSYEKGGNDGTANFNNYGNANEGSDTFKGYGEGSNNDNINFTSYFATNTTFTSYAKTGVDFKSYHNTSAAPLSTAMEEQKEKRKAVGNRTWPSRWVEPGRFFRESSLKKGTVMPMPDIRDRGFVHVRDCKRVPSRGETKQCATSAEDMIDFAVSVLGSDIQVRSTANTKGFNGDIIIGEVKGIDGGKVTESVSCHQSLFPYQVYYCHSVPRVRVYEAEILAVDTKEKINHGIAICHLDTSDWSPVHDAFVALGPAPGKIEFDGQNFVLMGHEINLSRHDVGGDGFEVEEDEIFHAAASAAL
ncbi:hypothetical protein HPP92_019836 [Vanilla planifolia]|uniref:BURP domain-containing protein n=1 Tax=Vanilla planifolia TaxID=51239 RepID=A0A835QD88_VANPL|nr:hypothetical protein HPP92_019836 [Vanilla planifolia]